MLQALTNTRPYAQPLSSIEVNGDRYALPGDFVSGIAFLRPILPRHGGWFHTQVCLLGGKLYSATNQLIVEYEPGESVLPNRWFDAKMIRTLEAFHTPPTELFSDGSEHHFRWDDGQELYMRQLHSLLPSDVHQRLVEESFSRFWRFNKGTKITEETRRYVKKLITYKKLAADIFIDGRVVASRMSSDGDSWTFESTDPFPTNATRIMRFDRIAFLNMIRVADEIDFTASPVCFRHAHGRGLLIERAATLDNPDFGQFDG